MGINSGREISMRGLKDKYQLQEEIRQLESENKTYEKQVRSLKGDVDYWLVGDLY